MLYKVTEQKSFTSGELMESKYSRIRVAKPVCEFTPRGEWYCWNEYCVVREVEISLKLFDEEMPSDVFCPVCKKKMTFHNWIEYETLIATGKDEKSEQEANRRNHEHQPSDGP